MRHAQLNAGHCLPPCPPVQRPIYTHTCHCCGITEQSPSPHPPAGWAVAWVDETSFLFCPQERLSAALGVVQ